MPTRIPLLICFIAISLAPWTFSYAQTPDGVEDINDFPLNYWIASYYQGRDGVPGSTLWGSPDDGGTGSGSRTFRGEAIFGIDSYDVTIASNGSAINNRWGNTETPTDPLLPDPSYVGTTWTGVNPHYQIDLRRKMAADGLITFGFGASEIVDDVIEVYINGVREYAYFPSGGAPDPRPGLGVGVALGVSADDEVLIRFMNLGFIGGFTFQFQHTAPSLPVLATSKTVSVLETGDFAIPGNDVSYTIAVTNTGPGTIDTNAVFLIDSLPSEVTFFNGDYDGAGPGTDRVGFINSGSGLIFDPVADVGFSSDITPPTSFANCSYSPSSGYDVNVRHVCFNPKGQMNAGSPSAGFSLMFRTRIN